MSKKESNSPLKMIFFIPHIQKTGVGKYYAKLIDHFGKSRVLVIGSTSTGCDIDCQEFAHLDSLLRYDLIIGHISIPESLRNPEFRHLRKSLSINEATLIRDPIERLISLYNFIKRWPHHPLHQEIQDIKLTSFLLRSPDNIQAKFLGLPQDKDYYENLESIPSLAFISVTEDNSHRLYKMVTGKHYEDIGFKNSSRDSELMQQNPGGLRLDIPYVDRREISDEVMTQLKERHIIDTQLYKLAKAQSKENTLRQSTESSSRTRGD